jgi:hypothetical protein
VCCCPASDSSFHHHDSPAIQEHHSLSQWLPDSESDAAGMMQLCRPAHCSWHLQGEAQTVKAAYSTCGQHGVPVLSKQAKGCWQVKRS